MFRFSLRAVFVLTLLAAICIAVVHRYVRPYRLQAVYIAGLQGNAQSVEADSVGPSWLRSVFGELASIRSITVSKFLLEESATFTAMTDLQKLMVIEQVDDSIAPNFREMIHLGEIDTSQSFVSLSALRVLPNPERVRVLKLGVNTNDDELLEQMPRFTGVVTLDLSATQVSDRGLSAIKACSQLKVLSLTGRPVTSDGLSQLGVLKNLETIELMWCDQLGPRIVDVLKSFRSLKKVVLTNNHLSESQRNDIRKLNE